MRNKYSNTISLAFVCAFLSVVIGFILNSIVLPIGYVLVHNCGRFICEHSYPITWKSYFIVTDITFILLFIIALMDEMLDNRAGIRQSHKSNYTETDHHENKTNEGPGYNLFEWYK